MIVFGIFFFLKFLRVFSFFLGLVGANDVFDDGSTQWTMTGAHAPLLDRTLVAHRHVSATVENRVDFFGVADDAFGVIVGVASVILPSLECGVVGSVIAGGGNCL